MLWSETPAGTIQAAQQQLWQELGVSGSAVARMMAEDEQFAATLARFASHGGHLTAVRVEDARGIMGQRFLGWDDARCVLPSGDLPEGIERYVPYSARTLEEHKKTHTLVAVPGVSIKQFRERFCKPGSELQPMFWEKHRFAIKRGIPGWYLVRTMPNPYTFDHPWETQLGILKPGEIVAPARIAAFAAACERASRGTISSKIYQGCYVRCEARASERHHIVIGGNDTRLIIRNDSDVILGPQLGLATMIQQEP